MNKPLLAGALCAVTALALFAKGKASDPILMTVGGKNVPLSEFEYLYYKNNSQQIQPQSLDEYVDMFVNYKLKVADAEAAGIDTTAKFVQEFEGYRNELAAPYLTDKEYEDSLLQVAYSHLLSNVDVSHIMIPLADENGDPASQIARIDSIYTALEGGADFTTLAKKYSSDRSVTNNGGHIGYITGGTYPYEFEEVAFNTPEGSYSKPFETRYGRHIIRRGAERLAPGEVHVRHILRLTRGRNQEECDVQKTKIDSIYNALIAGADFAQLASSLSEDQASAQKGGDLNWFGTGKMVPEFETVAFELKDGEISKPFETAYGYHIIQRLGQRNIKPLEEMAPDLKKLMMRDSRRGMIDKHRDHHFRSMYPATVNQKTIEAVNQKIDQAGATDTISLAAVLADINLVAFTIDGRNITVADVISSPNVTPVKGAETAKDQFAKLLDRRISATTHSVARDHLGDSNPDYRNLLGEYRDGMLLFEISNRNVWERASADTEGLENYFRNNRANYTWLKPHYKGYVVMATSDSVANLAKQWFAAEGSAFNPDSLAKPLRKIFSNNVRIEKVVTAKGDNVIVDYVAFDGPRPSDPRQQSRWKAWFAYNGKIIDQPEEAADVKGAVSTDYQQQLEKEWIEDLHAKYPVKINSKILKKVK